MATGNQASPEPPLSSSPAIPGWQAALASLIVPGSGQFWLGQRWRGLAILAAGIILLALILWSGLTVLLAALGMFWLWNSWDAFHLAGGRTTGLALPVLMAALVIYGIGVTAAEVQPTRLVTGWPAMQPYLAALARPELLARPTEDLIGVTPVQVPCIDPLPPPTRPASESPLVTPGAPCAAVGDPLTVRGEGFFPNFEGHLLWVNPIGDVQHLLRDGQSILFTTDDQGRFEVTITVPLAVPVTQQPGPGETETHLLRAVQNRPYGSLQATETLALVLEKIGETVALAFMATVLGVVFAVPVSFLAARNLMGGSRITRAIYIVVRTILNVVRSIETLMWAIIFAVWVGLGPFGGMLALWLHTVAALGKLYSEAIESIDPGPIEALRATGARAPQVIVYAVLPQILPTFTSFTLYRWDINVRMSTVIGLVSDAGLGFLVIQWIRLNQFSAMATAIIAIVLVVAILDYASGWLRQRIIQGQPMMQRASPWRRITQVALPVLFVLAFMWSWRVAQIKPVDLVRGAPEGMRLIRAFAVPDLFDRPTEEHTVSAALPVPCGRAANASAESNGPRINLSLSCGNVGEPLVITGHELPPEITVSIRWMLPDGAFLRVKANCCQTDATGTVRLETTIHPLMEMAAEATTPATVAITWQEVVGGRQLSASARTVIDLALVTLLMSLVATTFGSLVAIPVSFLAARNITGRGRFGRILYNVFRIAFNLFRSVEPMILVLICAAWVGAGPFAGTLALALNNIPNLGKLFADTIEEIDNRPVEAITATGAGRFQVLVYAIVPQLVPKFLAFILYQWDINIRMSTVIGFVGGGGIGQQFRLWIGMNQYSAAGTATLAIVLMVWSMDYMSARARARLV